MLATRRLGWDGPTVSVLGLGCNTLGSQVHGPDAHRVVRAALDAGVNFFDTAEMYGAGASERLLGEALRGRDDVIVATKCGSADGLSAAAVRRACEAALGRLQRDRIDLLQAHRWDPDVPLAETLGAMAALCDEGLVGWYGVSNYNAPQIQAAWSAGDPRLVSVQNRWNLLDGPDPPELAQTCRAVGAGVIPFSPLASGILTGKYAPGAPPPPGTRAAEHSRTAARLTPQRLQAVSRVAKWAAARELPLAELGVAWLLSHDEVSTVIMGARSPEQVRQGAHAAQRRLEPAMRDEVRAVAAGERQL